ncbi:MAG TPA: CDP-alcohol phosphatidyltransferase family protein [Ignavibacteriaceae bacterium]|nr:CDP-alcohol phosphatidyltransferase family protein [Ignavibacteriaceae bacterium]
MFTDKKTFTVSNLLSFLRLLSAIPIWYLFNDLESNRFIILIIALAGILSDYLDGYLARKLNEVSELGKIIDPIADKIVVGIIVIKLFLLNEIPDYFFYMVIGRDFLIFLGGIFLTSKIGKVLPSNMIGKITVSVLALLIILVIVQVDKNNIFFQIIYFATLILIVASFIAYLLRAIEFIKKKNYESV